MRYRISLIVLAAGLTGCGVVLNPIFEGKVGVAQRQLPPEPVSQVPATPEATWLQQRANLRLQA